MREACRVPVSVGSGLASRSVSYAVHLDVCPECGMPAHSHGLDPPPHHPCKVDYEEFVPQLYIAAPSLAEIDVLLRYLTEPTRDEDQPLLEGLIGWLEQIRDELANDVIEA